MLGSKPPKDLKFRPIGPRVLVKPEEESRTRASGLIIPDTVQIKPERGTVVSVGKRPNGDDIPLTKGDLVIFTKFAGTQVKLDGDDYLVVNEADVIGAL